MSAGFTTDPQELVIADEPQEWRSLSWEEAIQERRESEDETTKRLRAVGILPKWETDAAKVRSGERFFLLRNTWRKPSKGSGRVETYYTLGKIERPFCGLDAILSYVRRRVGNDADAVTEVLEALALGEIEPITRARARILYSNIHLKTGINLMPESMRKER